MNVKIYYIYFVTRINIELREYVEFAIINTYIVKIWRYSCDSYALNFTLQIINNLDEVETIQNLIKKKYLW